MKTVWKNVRESATDLWLKCVPRNVYLHLCSSLVVGLYSVTCCHLLLNTVWQVMPSDTTSLIQDFTHGREIEFFMRFAFLDDDPNVVW